MLIELKDIVKKANVGGLAGLKEIEEGYSGKALLKGPDSTNPGPFAWKFLNYTDYLMKAAECLEGQIVADLGVGKRGDGYLLAEICRAKAFIAVEHEHIQAFYKKMISYNKLRKEQGINKILSEVNSFIEQAPKYNKETVRRIQKGIHNHFGKYNPGDELTKIPIALIAEDMLSFLKRIPSKSISIITAGIDMQIISNDEYASQVEDEITRVINPTGAYLGMDSRFSPAGLRKDELSNDCNFVKYIR